jgi:type I restriction-modification system DNA methylase subunit
MFDVREGFDVVIGNPPYVTFKGKEKVEISDAELSNLIQNHPYSAEYKINSYALFIEDGFKFLNNNGNINYIIPSTILQNEYLKNIRKHLITNNQLIEIVSFENKVFDAVTDSIILIATKGDAEKKECKFIRKYDLDFENNDVYYFNSDEWINEQYIINLKTNIIDNLTISKIEENCSYIEDFLEVYVGVVASGIKRFLSKTKVDDNHKKYLQGKHLNNYSLKG